VHDTPRSTIVIWAIAAVLAVVAGARLLGGHAAPPVPVRLSQTPARPEERSIHVHVVGAVRRAGLMRMPEGSRVADAVERAGGPGPRADLTAVNLAARVVDGQQIVVPGPGSAAAGAAGGGVAAGAGGSPAAAAAQVHLSTATVEQLDGVDGIGPTLAERIIEYRDAHGGFRSLAELAEVEGIGEKRLATLREALQP
jgi:competence protein ComEA